MQVSPSTHVALVLRVLYRLRFLTEQVPFEVATFSYMSPLLNQILSKGGIGLTEEDDPLEQVALSLDLVKFHSAECELQLQSTCQAVLTLHEKSSIPDIRELEH